MDAERLSTIFHFPLSELAFVPEDKSAIKLVVPETARASADPGASEGPDCTTHSSSIVEAPVEAPTTPAELEARQRRIDGAKRVSQSYIPLPPHEATVDETQAELKRGFDCLVVAGSLHAKLVVMPLLRLLKPSSPLVVYSATPYPLLELQETLIREEVAMNVQISESWMREHQVLPSRTHPLMQMSGSSGFLLSGTRVHKKSNKPPSRNAAVAAVAAIPAIPAESNPHASPPSKKRKAEPEEERKPEPEEGCL
jgi:hypothetical protein